MTMYSTVNNMTTNNQSTSQTMSQPFLSYENAQMIWELLQETDIYNNIGQQEKIEIRSQFTKNMRAFNDKHTMSSLSLMERNKLFIGVVLNEHRRATIADAKQMKKTTASVATPASAHMHQFPTSKDVQEERRQVFEQDLQRKKNEFENSMSISKPDIPTFSDKMDEPISQMEDLINQTIASRELEMNQIFQSMSSNTNRQEPVWLQETSVKSEKASPIIGTTFKQIKIEKEEQHALINDSADIIDLNVKPESRNRVHFSIDEPVSLENPLSKFKKILEDKSSDNMFNKMDEINRKLDYLISKLGSIGDLNPGQVLNDQNHLHGLSSIHKV